MRLSANRGFPDPRSNVLARFQDPARVESALRNLGATLQRDHDSPKPTWNGTIELRGVERQFQASMPEAESGDTMLLDVSAEILVARVVFRFFDLSEDRCRVSAEATLTPHTTMARLALVTVQWVTRRLSKRLARLTRALGRR